MSICEVLVPVFLKLGGVKIYVYGGDHSPPHIHAIHAGKELLMTIKGREVLKTKGFKFSEIRAIAKAVALNEQALMEEWYGRNKK